MSTTTLSQRLRDLKDGMVDLRDGYMRPGIEDIEEIDQCIAQAEAMEGQAIGEQKPVAWMKRDTTSDMLPESALELVMEQDAAAYIRKTWMPLYRSPISPEARDRAIEALERISRFDPYEPAGPAAETARQALSALRS